MPKTLIAVMIAALAAFTMLTGACSDEPDEPSPTPTGQTSFPDEVQLTDGDDGASVQVALGGELIVALPSNPGTGFAWSVSESSGQQLELQGEPRYVPPGSTTPVVGAAGTEVFTFEAVDAGTAELVLEYRRAFEPNVPPEQTFSVTVEIR